MCVCVSVREVDAKVSQLLCQLFVVVQQLSAKSCGAHETAYNAQCKRDAS